MPATPGVSVDVELDPAIGLVASETWNPPVGIEAGRTIEEPTVDPAEVTVAQTSTKKGK